MSKLYCTFLVCIIVFISWACTPEKESIFSPPNIIFILTDDHSYQTLSAYDDRYIETPYLDQLAREGVLFTNSFVTNSICAPSRAVILTGKHSHMNGQINNSVRFDSSQLTFPKLLQEAGYQTAIIGKWHLKSEPTGFDYYDVLRGQGNYYNSDFNTNGNWSRSEGYVTNVITDRSLEWIESRDIEKPFCLMLNHKATHRIWMPDTSLFDFMDGEIFDLPENFFDDYSGRRAAAEQHLSIREDDMDIVYDLKMLDDEGELQTKYRGLYERFFSRLNPDQKAEWDAHYDPIIANFMETGLTGDELDKWKFQRYMEDYLRCVKSVDNNVGRVMEFLKDNELEENTLVVYTSDQGFYMGEHGWFDKRFMYEQSLRTPLIMRYPDGFEVNGEIDEMVQNLDHAPTILDFAGVEIPSEIQGVSMKPLLTGENSEWRDDIYYHYYEYPNEHMVKKHYGVRTDRYKLIHFYDDIDEWELYDLENDPEEMNNIYNDPSNDEIIQELKERIHSLQVHYLDPILSE